MEFHKESHLPLFVVWLTLGGLAVGGRPGSGGWYSETVGVDPERVRMDD